ncbi:MAG: hypothetical protein AAGF97_13035, partial [Planctomycetota bacterium]
RVVKRGDSTSRRAARRLLTVGLLCQATLQAVPTVQADTLQERVDQLILQLGADNYRDRETAEAELQALGLVAFEPLQAVRNHPDIEVRLRARAMVSQLRKFFLTDGIDSVMSRFVEGYENFTEDRRETIIQFLGNLLPQQGLEVLSRISRFEDSPRLAKRAALEILEATVRVDPEDRPAWLARVSEAAAISRRDATVWLRTFAALQEEGATSAARWQELLDAETQLQAGVSDDTDAETVHRLRRLQSDLLDAIGAEDNRRRELVAVELESEEVAREWLLWLQEREAWEEIRDMQQANAALFAGDRLLQYGYAEAQQALGNQAASQAAADLAFALGGPADDDATRNERDRIEIARFLDETRGQFAWAEREYRAAFSESPTAPNPLEEALGEPSYERYAALFPLSELLHDQQRDLEAAEVLQQYVDDAASQRALRNNALGREYGSIVSRMQFFYAEHHRAQGDQQRQREHLEEGFLADPTDADLLIAMYRFPGDSAWKTKVEKAIEVAASSHRKRIGEAQIAQESIRNLLNTQLADSLNQFAWLVGNTTGDGQEALRYSQRSLELSPGSSGYLDTLARCYYRVGNLEEAIRHQEWALARSPHEGQLRRQLEFFRRQQAP